MIFLRLLFTTATVVQSVGAQLWSNSSSTHVLAGTSPLRDSLTTSANTPSLNQTITDCQAALVSWSSLSRRLAVISTSLSTATWRSWHTVRLGAARNVSVEAGITFAEDLPHITSSFNFSDTYSVEETNILTIPTASIPPPPRCTIDAKSCSSLWDIYTQSLGLTGGATIISMDPSLSMTNSPRCRIDDSPLCITRRFRMEKSFQCGVNAGDVRVFFWPSPDSSITNAPRTIITSGITMSSPSVYLSYYTINAITGGGDWMDCANLTTPWKSMWLSTVGPTSFGHWYSALPQHVSTVEKAYTKEDWPAGALDVYSRLNPSDIAQPFPDAAITAMMNKNATDYPLWAEVIMRASTKVVYRQLDPDQLTRPQPRAYYLRPREYKKDTAYAYGCHPRGPHPHCDTIFNTGYHAQFSIPSELISLHPDWAACGPDQWGSYDPPIALTETDSAAQPVTTTSAVLTATMAQPLPTVPEPIITQTTTAGRPATQRESKNPTRSPSMTLPNHALDVLTETHSELPTRSQNIGAQASGSIMHVLDQTTNTVGYVVTHITVPSSITVSVLGSQVIVSGQVINVGAVTNVNGVSISRSIDDRRILIASFGGTITTIAMSSGSNFLTLGSTQSGVTISRSNSVFIVGSSELLPNQAITYGHNVISVDSSGFLFVNGATMSFQPTSSERPSTAHSSSTVNVDEHILNGINPAALASRSRSNAILTSATTLIEAAGSNIQTGAAPKARWNFQLARFCCAILVLLSWRIW